MSTTNVDPRRGELWYVDLEPTIGSEMQKKRPVVVVSSDVFRKDIPLRTVVPITGWKPVFVGKQYFVHIPHTLSNGLTKDSAAAVLQIRGVDIQRFDAVTGKIGVLSGTTMDLITAAVAAVIEHQ